VLSDEEDHHNEFSRYLSSYAGDTIKK